MTDLEVRLRDVGSDDEARIEGWYRAPHVAPQCRRLPATLSLLGRRVITWNAHDVGYVEWRSGPPTAAAADGTPTIELQLLIGEPGAIGHGIGSQALNILLAACNLLPSPPAVLARIRASNMLATRFFQSAGFALGSSEVDTDGVVWLALVRPA